ncbi:MAG: chromosome segregation ATPase, partial [Microcystaceae cyanobacterium]
AIYGEVETNLRKADWNGAFRDAVKLLNLDSRYWSTTKYNESLKNIQLAQEESSKLDTAYRILRQGGVDNWLKAIASAKKIPKTSYAYQESQGLVDQAKEKIQDYVQSLIEKKDWQTLASTTDR